MSSTTGEDSKPALKMKIKRKNVSATKTTSAEVKHEIIKDSDGQPDTAMMSSSDTALDRLKQALEKDRSTKVTKNSPSVKHKDRKKEVTSSTSSSDGLTLHIKREPIGDPYEFNSKVEDGPGPVTKKIKNEKDTADSSCQPSAMHTLSTAWGRRDVGVETSSIGVVTDPDCLGPCEPGSHVVLEGIVWNETPTGLLVVNVTWRGKTYVGTLMDATRHDWAPPRFNDESTPTEQDTRTPKGRGKRGRGAPAAPVGGESCTVGERRLRKTRGRMGSNNQAAHPASPGKLDLKRKVREDEVTQEAPKAKRGKILDAPGPDGMIVCPESMCCKRYRHVNGLRYHLTHFHKRNLIYDEEGNMITEAPEAFVKPAPVTDEAKFRKRTGLDATRADSPRKTPELMETLPPPSPKKMDEEKKRKDPIKKLDRKPIVSVAPITAVPSGTTNSQTMSNEPEGKKTKAKKTKQVPASTLASVTMHPQVSVSNGDQLQLIQPKPTILGTTPASSDLADSLKQMKETKRAKKKKKEKKKEHNKTVIKATTVSIPTLNDGAKQPPELHRQNMQPPQLDKQRLTPPDLQKANGQAAEATNSRTNRPPSSLSLNSPIVPPSKDDGDHHDSDDVHSPAYSDISDANDSVPVLENQSEDNKSTEKEPVNPQETPERPQEKSAEHAKGPQPYGLFPGSYYGQPPYLTPAVAPDAPKVSMPGEEKRKTPSDKAPTTPKEADKVRGHYPPGCFMGGAFPEKYRDQYMPPEFKAQKEAWLHRQKEAEPVDMSSKPIKKEQATDLSLKDKRKENKQIPQENLDLKSQMLPSSPVDDSKSALLDRQKDELQSYYVYQQQRMLEQQTRFLGKPKTNSPGLPHSSSRPSAKDSPKPPSTPTSSKPRTSWHPDEDPKDRIKGQERARPTPSPKGADDKRHGIPSSSPHPYAHYYPHYASGGQLPFDPAAHPSAIFPASMVPYGPNSAYMHPSQLHYLPDEDKERVAAKAEGGKALDLLQQRASQLYGISRNHSPNAPHKIHELKDAAKDRADSPVSSSKSPAPEKERVRDGAPASSKDDKSRSSSPPTQRHLHTHHHTHVVGPAYPIYGHYPSVMASPPGPSPPSHPLIQKPRRH